MTAATRLAAGALRFSCARLGTARATAAPRAPGAACECLARRTLASSAASHGPAPLSSGAGVAASGFAGGSSRTGSRETVRLRSPPRGTRQELPRLPNRRPLFIALAVVGVAGWAGFAQFATNKERLSSSAFRSCLVQIKDSAAAQAALGDPIMLVPSLVGDPWISGSVNTMQGRVDLSFEVQGPKGKGRAYFTSIRPAMHLPFEIIRFLIVTDKGESVSLLPD